MCVGSLEKHSPMIWFFLIVISISQIFGRQKKNALIQKMQLHGIKSSFPPGFSPKLVYQALITTL